MNEETVLALSILIFWVIHACYLWAALTEAREDKKFWERHYNMADSNYTHECHAHTETKKTLRELKQTLADALKK